MQRNPGPAARLRKIGREPIDPTVAAEHLGRISATARSPRRGLKLLAGAAGGLIVLAAPAVVMAVAPGETPPAMTPAGERGVVAPGGGRANNNKGGESRPDTPAPAAPKDESGSRSESTPNGPPPEAGPDVEEFSCTGPPPFAGHPARDGVDRSAQAHEFNEWRKANCRADEPPATDEPAAGTPQGPPNERGASGDAPRGKPDGTPGGPDDTPGPPDSVPKGKPDGTPGASGGSGG